MTNTEVKPFPYCLTKTIIQAGRGSATADYSVRLACGWLGVRIPAAIGVSR